MWTFRNSYTLFVLLTFSWCVITLTPLPLRAQSPEDEVNVKKINIDLVEDLFQKKINALRSSKNLSALQTDPILRKAAHDQALYMQKINTVTHDQSAKNKETPALRVRFYNGTHAGVGENCLSNYIGKKVLDKDGSATLIRTYEDLTEQLFLQWKNSPGHYKNMIDPQWRFSGLSLVSDPHTGKLFAAQVFGTRPYVASFPSFSNTSNSWGILPSESKTCNSYGEYEEIASIFSQYLVIDGDSVFQYYRDPAVAKAILSGPKDGIAVDIVFREQFGCDPDHNLHYSEVHDGIMLPPVYSTQLFRNNQGKATGEFYSFVGVLPKGIQDKKFQLNTVLIRNGRMCRYSYPIDVLSKNRPLLQLRPVWMHYVGEIREGSYRRRFSFDLPFASGSVALPEKSLGILLDKLQMYSDFITSVKIQAYSSVDGNKMLNEKLQLERAEAIRELVLASVKREIPVQMEALENWTLFEKQARDSFPDLAAMDQAQVKHYLSNAKNRERLRGALDEQRIARVELDVDVKWNNRSPVEHLPVAIRGVLVDGDSVQARIMHSRMVQGMLEGKINPDQFTEIPIPESKRFVPAMINYMGALSLSEKFEDDPQLPAMVNAYKLGKGHPKMEFNHLVYVLRYWASFEEPLLDPAVIEKNILSLRSDMGDSLTNSLLLNCYVLSAYHYWINHQFDLLNAATEGVYRLMKLAPVNEKEAIELALFFNLYYRFERSMEILRPFILPKTCSLEALFLYTRTASLNRRALSDQEYYSLVQACAERDKSAFCQWIDETDFQLLRDTGVQQIWCTNCSTKE